MKFLDRLEKRYGSLAIPNVVLFLIIAQLVVYAAIIVGRVDYVALQLITKQVLAGEWWRLFSFTISPPWVAYSLPQGLFLVFFWYILWMMSSALEEVWGVFKFNVFLLSGVLFAIVGAFLGQLISPSFSVFVSPYFLQMSVFFAFATILPNFEFLLFFFVPVKVKWLAWFAFAMLMVSIIEVLSVGAFGMALAIVAPLMNYILFFRGSFKQSMDSRNRRTRFEKESVQRDSDALHICSSCGATDRSAPERDFRYKMVDGDAVYICNSCRETA